MEHSPQHKEYTQIMGRYASTLGRNPDGYRELATAWTLWDERNMYAYSVCAHEVKNIKAQMESAGKKWADGKTGARRLGMHLPAMLRNFLQYSDPEIFTNDRKYNRLKRALPELTVTK